MYFYHVFVLKKEKIRNIIVYSASVASPSPFRTITNHPVITEYGRTAALRCHYHRTIHIQYYFAVVTIQLGQIGYKLILAIGQQVPTGIRRCVHGKTHGQQGSHGCKGDVKAVL